MKARGFDNEKYLDEQSKAIIERAAEFGDRLYLEFGGKLLFDMHAARILPGFDPNVKMRLLQKLRDKVEIIICIHSGDIERKKLRADFGITYDVDILKLIDDLRAWNLGVAGVVITRFDNQPATTQFITRLERRGIKVFTHRAIKGYPTDIDGIVSDRGYGSNPYIETTRPVVVVTAPGPGSGKLATCLNQLYHEHKRGVACGYAKFETFPIWNLPLRHPVNIAYEAATVDLADFNMVDPFHLDAYSQVAINYNRDVEAFPLLKRILEKISGVGAIYRSPTDMGVNRAGFAICDDAVVREASYQEIIRRYFRCHCEYAMGVIGNEAVASIEKIMREADLVPERRLTVLPAREAARDAELKGKGNKGVYCGAALELDDGSIVTGKNSTLMHASSSVVLNAVKTLAGVPDPIHLISENVMESISRMKTDILGARKVSLSLDETLIALAISATHNPTAQVALQQLCHLQGCEMHLTHMPSAGDEGGLRQLGVNLTSEATFSGKELFA